MKRDFDRRVKTPFWTGVPGNKNSPSLRGIGSAIVGALVARGVEYDSERQRKNCHVEVKEVHNSYKFFTKIILNVQKSVAKSNPEMILVTASGANWGIRNGTTAEAIHTCPRSAAISETTFVCAGDNAIVILWHFFFDFSRSPPCEGEAEANCTYQHSRSKKYVKPCE